MKGHKLTALFLLMVLLMVSSTLVSAAEVLNKNTGFEEEGEGIPGWRIWPKDSAEKRLYVTEELAKSGKKSLKWENSDPSVYVICLQSIDAKSDEVFKGTGFINTKGLKNGTAQITLEFYTEKDEFIASKISGKVQPGMDWTEVVSETPPLPKNVNYVLVMCYVSRGATGVVYFDDVVVEKTK